MTELFDFELIRTGSVGAVTGAFARFDDAQRKELAGALSAYVRQRSDNWWARNEATALAVAAVGCLPGAAAAAQILGRSSVSLPMEAARPVLDTATARGITWLPDLARRLADRRGARLDHDEWRFIAELLTAHHEPPPTSDVFVLSWLRELGWTSRTGRPRPLADRLRADPFLDTLLPRVFEVDGAGAALLLWEGHREGKLAVVQALVELADEKRLDRGMLLDGCVGRLLRGDNRSALRGCSALHDLLAPTPDETAARAGDYLRLLADAPTTIATAAQKLLRATGAAELDGLLDAARAVLARPDKALVRAQLTWLDALARQHRDRAAEIAGVIAVATAHPAAEIRDRATALAAKHGHAPPSTRRRRAPAAAPAGTVARDDDLPPPAAVLPAPPPITDPDELAEEVAALLSARLTALPLERVLDGAVRLAATDQSRLGAALIPVLERHRGGMGDHGWDPCCLCGTLIGVLHGGADLREAAARRGKWAGMLADARRLLLKDQYPPDPRIPPPHRLLRTRLAEIGFYAGPSDRPGGLVSAPTSANGALDPAALLERLSALGERAPWPWDLTQALLRLPPAVDEATATAAAALHTPAGDRLAAWLRAGGLPAPVWRVLTTPRPRPEPGFSWRHQHLPAHRLQTEFGLTPPHEAPDDPLRLFGPSRQAAPDSLHHGWEVLWPALMPGYRGLVASFALPDVAAAADMDQRGGAAVLPLLAECTGDGGAALPIALAYGLGARHEADRAATLDALLMLAAAGTLDAPAVGHHLATLSTGGTLTLTRTLQPLRDAATAGARHTVWRLLAAALPTLLATPSPPRGTPDLLTLAAETATPNAAPTTDPTTVPITIPGLTTIATRRSSSRLTIEARRLTATLSPPPTPT